MEWFKQAHARLMKDDHFGAIVNYEKFLSINPNNVIAWINLGILRKAQMNWNGAIEAFDRAINLRDLHAEGVLRLGTEAKARGDLIQAIVFYMDAFLAESSLTWEQNPMNYLINFEKKLLAS